MGRTLKTLKNLGLVVLLLAGVGIFCSHAATASESFTYSPRPFIHSFDKKSYGAANQNWSISQGPNGFMYFGNTNGLLEYNGNEWTLYQLPDKLIIRSVFADKDGRIYSGAHEEFGYWTRNEQGRLAYKSLISLLPKNFKFSNEDIWNIKRIGRTIYFQSFSKLYAFDGRKLAAYGYDKPIFCLMEFEGKPAISFIGGGISWVEQGGKLSPIRAASTNQSVNNIIKISKDTTLVVTELNGISLIVKNEYKGSWDCPANEQLKSAHINRSLLYKGGTIVVGTINNGIYLVDKKGRIVKNFDNNNGLQNNTILSILVDKSQNLWAGLDKGIDFINLSAPYTFYIENSASIGSVYSAAVGGKTLYIGTNHGLFCASWDGQANHSLRFTTIPTVKGQVWNLQSVGDGVICGSNSGTFLLNNGRATLLSSINGGNQIAQPLQAREHYYQGTYTGISIFKKDAGGKLTFTKVLQNFYAPIKSLQFDHENTIWAGDIYKGVYRIWLNKTLDTAIKVERYGKKDGFSSDYNIQVFKVENAIVFSNLTKFYTFDYINRKVVDYKHLNNQLGAYAAAHTIYRTSDQEYWLAKSNYIQRFSKNGEMLARDIQISYNALGTSAVDGYENIWKITPNIYLLGLDNGFFTYQTNLQSSYSKAAQPMVYKVESFTNKGEMRLAPISLDKNKISFRRRNLIIHISVPGEIEGTFEYRYRFDDDEAWLDAKDATASVNGLSSGNHTIFLQAIDRRTNSITSSSYSFTIRPPWYRHPIAYLFYIAIIYFAVRGIRMYLRLRHRKQKYEYLKKMKEHKRMQLENLQKEHLQHQVENKANELANYTMLIRAKNEVLQRIKEIIDEQAAGDSTTAAGLKKSILSLIDKNLSNRNDWEQFQSFFDEANKAFTTRLKKMHPDLTPNDLRFCSFLRMNMSSKEISNLLNISERSVEVKRYRLRKRLSMEHDTNLIKYLMDI